MTHSLISVTFTITASLLETRPVIGLSVIDEGLSTSFQYSADVYLNPQPLSNLPSFLDFHTTHFLPSSTLLEVPYHSFPSIYYFPQSSTSLPKIFHYQTWLPTRVQSYKDTHLETNHRYMLPDVKACALDTWSIADKLFGCPLTNVGTATILNTGMMPARV